MARRRAVIENPPMVLPYQSLGDTLEESRRTLRRIHIQLSDTEQQMRTSRATLDQSMQLLRTAFRLTEEKRRAEAALCRQPPAEGRR
jgi:hypothetical protein